MKCVHCLKTVSAQSRFVYPTSRAIAHVGCVSFPSIPEIDALLLAQQTRPTRLVYSTGTRGTRS